MIEKVLLAAVAGLFGLIPALLQWVSERSKSRSRNGQLSRLLSELQYLNEWAKIAIIFKDTGAPHQDTKIFTSLEVELKKNLAEYASLREEVQKTPLPAAEISSIRRYLLLFPPSGFKGWLVHSIFYSFGIFTFTLLCFIVVYGDLIAIEGELFGKIRLFISVFAALSPFLFLLQKIGWYIRDTLVQQSLENVAAMKEKVRNKILDKSGIVTIFAIGLPFSLFLYFSHAPERLISRAILDNSEQLPIEQLQHFSSLTQISFWTTFFSWLMAVIYATRLGDKQRFNIFFICALSGIAMPIIWLLLL
jgi:hypothetical protein